jgi:arylsulfatase A-like enzyme
MRLLKGSRFLFTLAIVPFAASMLGGCGDDSTWSTGGAGSSSSSSSSSSTGSSSSGGGQGGAGGEGTGTGGVMSGSGGAGGGGTGGMGGGMNCMDPQPGNAAAKRVIIFVWDGLRPDSINATDTPTLAQLKQGGSSFSDNHSTYPTFTMMNSASFATGSFPGATGFYGNTQRTAGATGNNSAGTAVDFNQPVFTEDYAVLDDLDAYYDKQLFLVGTLFEAAQAKGLATVVIGKSGAAYLQDRHRGGIILDEKTAYPLSFAQELQAANYPLPKTTPIMYQQGEIALSANNGDPTASPSKKTLADGVTGDPTDTSGNPYTAANAYMMGVFVDYILPQKKPDLSLIWMRNPDSTEHAYGPGTANYKDALLAQDKLLAQLQAKLVMLGMDQDTDIIIVSDHGHSSVAGPTEIFPLRKVEGGQMNAPDPNGYSASGVVRMADLLTRAGFKAFDGSGCSNDPVMTGIKTDGSQVYPTMTDADGSIGCGVGKKYSTKGFKVPAQLPQDALVVAANGGSDYIYAPGKDPQLIKSVISFLQTREEVGAIFVDSSYGNISGTLPLDLIKVENMVEHRNPDIVFSYTWDDKVVIAGMPGIEYNSSATNRGMHGSFSPIDVHNTLIAAGPDFRAAFTDPVPSGNVDVAPTVAHLLGLEMPGAQGRPLYEALMKGVPEAQYDVKKDKVTSTQASGLVMKKPTSPDGADVDANVSKYQIELSTKNASFCGKSYTYFDEARAVRQ